MGPVSSGVTVLVTKFQVHIFGHKQLHKVDVTLTGSDVEAREATLVFYFGVSSAVDELVHHVPHVLLSCQVHRGVSAYSFVIAYVRLRVVPQQYIDNSYVLSLHCVLINRKSHQLEFHFQKSNVHQLTSTNRKCD